MQQWLWLLSLLQVTVRHKCRQRKLPALSNKCTNGETCMLAVACQAGQDPRPETCASKLYYIYIYIHILAAKTVDEQTRPKSL
jgi:hypothetical protein